MLLHLVQLPSVATMFVIIVEQSNSPVARPGSHGSYHLNRVTPANAVRSF